MRRRLAALVATLAAGALAQAGAQEIVTLPTRAGVTQPFFIANMESVKPEAAALLFSGGGGGIRLRTQEGQIRFGTGNFLMRSRGEFIRNRILPVIMDNPSDQQSGAGMSDAFRASPAHLADIRAVVAEVKRRYPGLQAYLVGTSRSSISVAHLGRAMAGEVAGIVLSSSVWSTRERSGLETFDWGSIRLPLLLVHHREDGCWGTLYNDIPPGALQHPLISVNGGKPPQSGPCDPYAPHGFFGKEAETVDAIAAWMLGKPFRKEID